MSGELRPCGKPVATDADWERFDGGEGEHLCWCDNGSCDQGYTWEDRAVSLAARLAEVEQALREAKEALDKTVPVLLTVKPNLDRPYPDALTLTPWTRWCEPLARRVDDARRSARAVLDKGEQPDG